MNPFFSAQQLLYDLLGYLSIDKSFRQEERKLISNLLKINLVSHLAHCEGVV